MTENKISKAFLESIDSVESELRTSQRMLIGNGNINIVWFELDNGYQGVLYTPDWPLQQSLQKAAREVFGVYFQTRNGNEQYLERTIRGKRIKAAKFTYWEDNPDIQIDLKVKSFTQLMIESIKKIGEKGYFVILDHNEDPEDSGIVGFTDLKDAEDFVDELKAEVENSNRLKWCPRDNEWLVFNGNKRTMKATLFTN